MWRMPYFDHGVRLMNEPTWLLQPPPQPPLTPPASHPLRIGTIYKEVHREYTCYTGPRAVAAVAGPRGSAEEAVPLQAQRSHRRRHVHRRVHPGRHWARHAGADVRLEPLGHLAGPDWCLGPDRHLLRRPHWRVPGRQDRPQADVHRGPGHLPGRLGRAVLRRGRLATVPDPPAYG